MYQQTKQQTNQITYTYYNTTENMESFMDKPPYDEVMHLL